jgi:mannosyltransferase OCH1-like enzyme
MHLSYIRSKTVFDDGKHVMEKVNTMTATYGCYIQTRIRRSLRIYIACALLIILYFSANSFGGFSVQSSLRRAPFPKKIWQTWKVDPLSFEERESTRARSWIEKNPNYRYEVLTDQNDLQYVESNFGPNGFNRPDIVFTYRSLTAKIVKADLLRYLIMYVDGGLYADIDVQALRSIQHFIPERFNEKDIDMVVGVEIDQPEYNNHTILGKKSQSFCQWTFMCKPRLPIMMRLIENVINWLNEVAKRQNKPISAIELDFDEIISGTGPSAFTEAILAEMSYKTGKKICWDSFHNLRESKDIGGVLVLTVEAFAAGQGHSDSGNHDGKIPLVKHHYHASGWPTQHPRYKHPMFGEVEDCNWDSNCVRAWDENIAAFDALPPDEQSKQIAMKEAKEAVAAEEAAAAALL